MLVYIRLLSLRGSFWMDQHAIRKRGVLNLPGISYATKSLTEKLLLSDAEKHHCFFRAAGLHNHLSHQYVVNLCSHIEYMNWSVSTSNVNVDFWQPMIWVHRLVSSKRYMTCTRNINARYTSKKRMQILWLQQATGQTIWANKSKFLLAVVWGSYNLIVTPTGRMVATSNFFARR